MFRCLPRFEYLAPGTVNEACAMLAKYSGEAKVIAGGTDLLPQMKWGEIKPKYIIGLANISDLKGIKCSSSAGLTLGALTTIRAIERSAEIKESFPLLAQAASVLGSVEVRNRGTVGGNLCNAVPSADMAPSLVALGAQVRLVSEKGERILPLEEFFKYPNQTVLGPSEILAQIEAPNIPPRSGGAYIKLERRNAMDLPIVGVAALVNVNGGSSACKGARIVLGAVAPTPMRAVKAEKILKENGLGEATIEKAAQVASEEAKPISDIRASADYRREMVKVLTRRAIKQALGQVK